MNREEVTVLGAKMAVLGFERKSETWWVFKPPERDDLSFNGGTTMSIEVIKFVDKPGEDNLACRITHDEHSIHCSNADHVADMLPTWMKEIIQAAKLKEAAVARRYNAASQMYAASGLAGVGILGQTSAGSAQQAAQYRDYNANLQRHERDAMALSLRDATQTFLKPSK